MSDLKIQTEWLPQLSAEEFNPEAAAHMTGGRGEAFSAITKFSVVEKESII